MAIRDDARAVLERLLVDESPAVQARTWQAITELKDNVAQEFFVLFIAIGKFSLLVETAPNIWQGLFERQHQELDKWSSQNLETLKSLSSQAAAMTDLANDINELTSLTRQLSKASLDSGRVSVELGTTLNKLEPMLRHSIDSSQAIKPTLESLQVASELSQQSVSQRLGEMKSEIESLRGALQNPGPMKRFGILSLSFSVMTLAVMTCLGFQVDALMLRVSRKGCGSGLIAKESRVCQRLCARQWIPVGHVVCQRQPTDFNSLGQ